MSRFSRNSRILRALCGDIMHQISLKSHMKHGKYGRYFCKPLSNAKFGLKWKPCAKNSCYYYFFPWKFDRNLSCRQCVTQWLTEGCGVNLKGVGFHPAKGFRVNWYVWDVRSALQEGVEMLTLRYGLVSALSTRNPSHTVAVSRVVTNIRRLCHISLSVLNTQGGGSSRLTASCNSTPYRQAHN